MCPWCLVPLGISGQRGSVRAKQVSSDSHLNIIKTPALISNSLIKREKGAREEGDEGMKERVESGRSETGSGEKRRAGPLPVSQGGRELAWLQGRARVSVWRGHQGREGGPVQ